MGRCLGLRIRLVDQRVTVLRSARVVENVPPASGIGATWHGRRLLVTAEPTQP